MSQPTVTRRAILRAGAIGAAGVALPLRLIDAVAAQVTSANTWTYSQYRQLVGSTFRVTPRSGSTTRIKLIAATNLMPSGSSTTSGPQCFALTFSGGLPAALGDGTENVYNFKLGSVRLYISPGMATSTAQHYTAIVNRL
jgi:hypothetical protein